MKGSRAKLKEGLKEMFNSQEEDNWLKFIKENYTKMSREQRLDFLMGNKVEIEEDYNE